MTYKLSTPSATIISQGLRILSLNNLTLSSPADKKAGAIFRYVRDEIRFGFTSRFDEATPEETLQSRRGHCNPQSALFGSLLNSVGIKASQKFVELSAEVLHGVINTPDTVVHSCVVVTIGNEEFCVDGFIVGKDVFEGARKKLVKEGRSAGYGIAKDGCCEWEGYGDCFVQMTRGVKRELGVFDEPYKFLKGEQNFQKLGVIGRFVVGVASLSINRRIDGLGRMDG